MVFAGEGLRAPRVGPSINTAPPAMSGRAVAGTLLGAAAAAGIAGTVGLPQAPLNAPYAGAPPPITRDAPVPSNAANPLLSGATGARAPSLGGGMPSTGSPIASPSGAVPSTPASLSPRGSGIAGMGAALADAGLRKLGEELQSTPGSPFYVSPQQQLKNDQFNKAVDDQNRAIREGINDLARDFGDWLKDPTGRGQREKSERTGDQFKNPPRKGDGKEQADMIAGVPYLLVLTGVSADGSTYTNVSGDYYGTGGVSLVSKQPKQYDVAGNESKDILVNGVLVGGGTFTAATLQRKDGVPTLPQPPTPESFNPGDGLYPPTVLGDLPILPPLGLNRPAPTRAVPPGSTNPNPIRPNTPLPSNQPKGDATKQPQATSPNLPSTGTPLSRPGAPTLPSIPSAPTSGSATAPAPIFPSSFTQTPTVRNPQATQPIQPSSPRLPQPTPCADPCIRTLQQQQADNGNLLDSLGELLSQLLEGQQEIPDNSAALDEINELLSQLLEGQQQQEEQNELSLIQVPIVTCKGDGTSDRVLIAIEVPKNLEKQTLEQFKALANLQEHQCRAEYFSERSHNILGGDEWFKTPGDRSPVLAEKPEQELKRFAKAFGFPEPPPIDPRLAKEEAELEKRTQKPAPGKVTVGNLPGLIRSIASLLYHRTGLHGFPAEVPKTLLGYSDDEKPQTLTDFAAYFHWYIKQFDALVGKFPIEITIEDADPAQKGKQTRTLELPNISEALAEMYGLSISGVTNSDLTVNMLARIAVETVAAKNAALIGQDYSKANASFLGYKGNTVKRSIQYAFNPQKFDTLDEFLANTRADIEGWEEQDPETVVGFLQRLVFAAGIIKSVYFRDKDLIKQFEKEAASLLTKDKDLDDARWLQFVQMLNNPDSQFNTGDNPQPKADKEPGSNAKA